MQRRRAELLGRAANRASSPSPVTRRGARLRRRSCRSSPTTAGGAGWWSRPSRTRPRPSRSSRSATPAATWPRSPGSDPGAGPPGRNPAVVIISKVVARRRGARMDNAEESRRREADDGTVAVAPVGPYLSERQWGTVREDYSDDGDAWSYFTHDQARSRAYRWGEDGLAGISDDHQRLCFALALWNEQDPILKERLFGLTNAEGNHGEDVKEYYFYVDNTPTHRYLRWLYKYPQAPTRTTTWSRRTRARSPLRARVRAARHRRLRRGPLLRRRGRVRQGRARTTSRAHHGAQPRARTPPPLHLLPTLWFRNTWWRGAARRPEPPVGRCGASRRRRRVTRSPLHHDGLGTWHSATRRRRPRAAVLRQRDQRGAPVGSAERRRRTRRTASTTTSCSGARRR